MHHLLFAVAVLDYAESVGLCIQGVQGVQVVTCRVGTGDGAWVHCYWQG